MLWFGGGEWTVTRRRRRRARRGTSRRGVFFSHAGGKQTGSASPDPVFHIIPSRRETAEISRMASVPRGRVADPSDSGSGWPAAYGWIPLLHNAGHQNKLRSQAPGWVTKLGLGIVKKVPGQNYKLQDFLHHASDWNMHIMIHFYSNSKIIVRIAQFLPHTPQSRLVSHPLLQMLETGCPMDENSNPPARRQRGSLRTCVHWEWAVLIALRGRFAEAFLLYKYVAIGMNNETDNTYSKNMCV